MKYKTVNRKHLDPSTPWTIQAKENTVMSCIISSKYLCNYLAFESPSIQTLKHAEQVIRSALFTPAAVLNKRYRAMETDQCGMKHHEACAAGCVP